MIRDLIVYGSAVIGSVLTIWLFVSLYRVTQEDQAAQREWEERNRRERLDAAFRIAGDPLLFKVGHQKPRSGFTRNP